MPTIPEAVVALVRAKHKEYARASQLNRIAYYVTRTVAAISAALLPFTVGNYPTIATPLAILVALTLAVDYVYNPRAHWQLNSNATDLLAVELFKALGQFDQAKSLLDVITRTEAAKLGQLVDLKEVVDKVKQTVEQRGDGGGVAQELAPVLDRLLHHAHVLTCGPRSWRTRLQGDQRAPGAVRP